MALMASAYIGSSHAADPSVSFFPTKKLAQENRRARTNDQLSLHTVASYLAARNALQRNYGGIRIDLPEGKTTGAEILTWKAEAGLDQLLLVGGKAQFSWQEILLELRFDSGATPVL
ncbi:hypothetical protein KM043_013703 [Ampulex compressa]|nr:hypothetical protein KM043_013703 [Ampulex compressa]